MLIGHLGWHRILPEFRAVNPDRHQPHIRVLLKVVGVLELNELCLGLDLPGLLRELTELVEVDVPIPFGVEKKEQTFDFLLINPQAEVIES